MNSLYYTDYPITALGDIPGQPAPVREVKILKYDHDKYCTVLVAGLDKPIEIKAGYIYSSRTLAPYRFEWSHVS